MNKVAIIRYLANASPAEQEYLMHVLRAAILSAAQKPLPETLADEGPAPERERQWFFITGFDGP